MIDYSSLINKNRIKPGKFSNKQIRDCLVLSKRDIKFAKEILKENQDWAFNIAYNGMLQAAKALMYSKGFRPSGVGHHTTIIEFARILLNDKYSEIIDTMDIMRRKRNIAVYDQAGIISNKEAVEAIGVAKCFIKIIDEILK